MAALNTLRTKGSLLLTLSIGISLLAFLLMDGASALDSNSTSVGTINGKEVDTKEYATEVELLTTIRQFVTGQSSLTPEQSEMLQGQAWNKFINEIALFPTYDKLGLGVSDNELANLVQGEEISPVIRQYFSDPSTGSFDRLAVTRFFSNISSDPSGRSRMFGRFLENQVAEYTTSQKFNTLVKEGMFVTDFQMTEEFNNGKDDYSIEYVTKSIMDITDDQVTVTDEALRAYYEKHKARFIYSDASEVEYVTFDIVPSASDYEAAQQRSLTVTKELKETKDAEQYVSYTSEEPFNPQFFTAEQLPTEISEQVVTASVGDVFEPVFAGDIYSITRLNSTKTMPDTLGLRSIVIPTTMNVDSIFNIAKASSAGFESVVSSLPSLSTQASAEQMIGGGAIAPLYEKELLNAKVGNTFMFDVNGAKQIVRVTKVGKRVRGYQLATVVFAVTPSNETESNIYQQANNFVNIANEKGFTAAVMENQYITRNATVNTADRQFARMDGSLELVRWSFVSDEGAISHVVDLDNVNVVAFLKKKMEKGAAPFEDVKEQVRTAYIQKAKMDLAVKELSNAQSMESLCDKLGAEVQSAANLSFSDFAVPGIGVAPEVIGALTALSEGQVSQGIPASMSAVAVKLLSKGTKEGFDEQKARLLVETDNESYIDARIGAALEKLIEIRDFRVIYY